MNASETIYFIPELYFFIRIKLLEASCVEWPCYMGVEWTGCFARDLVARGKGRRPCPSPAAVPLWQPPARHGNYISQHAPPAGLGTRGPRGPRILYRVPARSCAGAVHSLPGPPLAVGPGSPGRLVSRRGRWRAAPPSRQRVPRGEGGGRPARPGSGAAAPVSAASRRAPA